MLFYLEYTLPTIMSNVLFMVSAHQQSSCHTHLLHQPECFTSKTHDVMPLFIICGVKMSNFHTVRQIQSVSKSQFSSTERPSCWAPVTTLDGNRGGCTSIFTNIQRASTQQTETIRAALGLAVLHCAALCFQLFQFCMCGPFINIIHARKVAPTLSEMCGLDSIFISTSPRLI